MGFSFKSPPLYFMTDIQQKPDVENAFTNLFGGIASGTGEEELLRIAARFSRQISARQMRCLVRLTMAAEAAPKDSKTKAQLMAIVEHWLEYKQYHNSNLYVMRALDSISLRKYINDSSFKVNVQKQ